MSDGRLIAPGSARLAGLALAISLSGCGGGTSGNALQIPGPVTPTTNPGNPGSPANLTQSVTLGLAKTVTFGQNASGASGSIDFPATSTGQGPATISLLSTLPAGVPIPQSVKHRSAAASGLTPKGIGAAVTPLAYIVVKPSSPLVFRATPGLTFTFPAGVLAGYAYLAFFDPVNPQLGWNTVAGPVPASGTSVHVPSQSYVNPPLALGADTAYIFAIVQNGSVLPTRPPAPFTITEYLVPGPASYVVPIAAGPDGNLWFFQQNGSGGEGVGKISTSGIVTRFPLSVPPYRNPQSITAGPDGNVWFTETANSSVAKITPSGAVTEYPLPTTGSAPWGITTGPDGNLWFCEPDLAINGGFPNGGYGGIGKITPNGVATDYPFPIPAGTPPNSFARTPTFITAGPDGNLWFTESANNDVGKITTSGVITIYPLPSAGAIPAGITAGPDGNVWFVESGLSGIAKITPSGVITELPAIISHPGDLEQIVVGSDGNFWVSDVRNGLIFRITPSGIGTGFPTPTQPSSPVGMAAGPDGNIWFTEADRSQIGRLLVH